VVPRGRASTAHGRAPRVSLVPDGHQGLRGARATAEGRPVGPPIARRRAPRTEPSNDGDVRGASWYLWITFDTF